MYVVATCYHQTYQSLPLEQGSVPVEHKHGPDAEVEQLADPVEQSEEVSVLNTAPISSSHALHSLVQPDTDVWTTG